MERQVGGARGGADRQAGGAGRGGAGRGRQAGGRGGAGRQSLILYLP